MTSNLYNFKDTVFARITLSPAGLAINMNVEYIWDQRALVFLTSSRTAVLRPRYTLGMGTAFSRAQHPVDLYFRIEAIVHLSLIFSNTLLIICRGHGSFLQ